MSTPVPPNDPQSPPRDIPAMPEPHRVREAAEGEELRWPDVPINEVPDAEREALLQQAGPVGEQARLAWNAYQEGQQDDQAEPDAAAVARERTRLQEMGQVPPEGVASTEAASGRPATQQGATTATTTGSATTVTEKNGGAGERADAEKKAKARGLEVRDFGPSGDWRLYDPKTGRQVSKDKLDEPA